MLNDRLSQCFAYHSYLADSRNKPVAFEVWVQEQPRRRIVSTNPATLLSIQPNLIRE